MKGIISSSCFLEQNYVKEASSHTGVACWSPSRPPEGVNAITDRASVAFRVLFHILTILPLLQNFLHLIFLLSLPSSLPSTLRIGILSPIPKLYTVCCRTFGYRHPQGLRDVCSEHTVQHFGPPFHLLLPDSHLELV